MARSQGLQYRNYYMLLSAGRGTESWRLILYCDYGSNSRIYFVVFLITTGSSLSWLYLGLYFPTGMVCKTM